MKLHEAIFLGSKLITAKAGDVGRVKDSPGCALGMACDASGSLSSFGVATTNTFYRDLNLLQEKFPAMNHFSSFHCGCAFSTGGFHALSTQIVHLFDQHVMGIASYCVTPSKDMTLEELVDYVKTREEEYESTITTQREPGLAAPETVQKAEQVLA